MVAESGGPYLSMAVLCEKVLQEKDGVLSAIRVVDRIVVQPPMGGTQILSTMPRVTVNLTALLCFKSGAARGRHTVKLRPEEPSGLKGPELSLPVLFEGDERGANLVINLTLESDREGLSWWDVLLDEQLVTRVPLRIVYQPVGLGTSA